MLLVYVLWKFILSLKNNWSTWDVRTNSKVLKIYLLEAISGKNRFIVFLYQLWFSIFFYFLKNFDMVPAEVVDMIDCLFHFQANLLLKHPFENEEILPVKNCFEKFFRIN